MCNNVFFIYIDMWWYIVATDQEYRIIPDIVLNVNNILIVSRTQHMHTSVWIFRSGTGNLCHNFSFQIVYKWSIDTTMMHCTHVHKCRLPIPKFYVSHWIEEMYIDEMSLHLI